MRTGSIVKYYDTVAKKVVNQVNEFALRKLKKVIWNSKMTCCALITNKYIFLMNKNFQRTARVHEGTKIVEAFWNADDVLIYSTLNHLKYALSNGDKGIIKSLDQIVYPIDQKGEKLHYFKSTGDIEEMKVNCDELSFKRCIQRTDIKSVKKFVKSKNTPGNSMIAYL